MKFIQHKSFIIATIAIISVIVISFITINISRSNNITSEEVQKTNGKVIILTDKTFDQTIKKGITLVDFWAVWCGPCKKQGPIIDKIAEEYGSKAKICKLDTDQNPVISNKYNVTLIPTILIFKNGIVVQKYVGLQQKETLVNKIKELL